MIRRGSGTRRSTENTAAASVEDRIAPTSSAVVQSRCSRKCAATPTTATETSTPTVESTAAGATESADARPPRAEAALGEDEDQGGVAEHLGELGGVELDAEAGLADGQADGRGRAAGRAARTAATSRTAATETSRTSEPISRAG